MYFESVAMASFQLKFEANRVHFDSGSNKLVIHSFGVEFCRIDLVDLREKEICKLLL